MLEIWLTKEEIQKREEQLEILKGERRLEIAEMLKAARAFGDLSENAEYDAAKNEQAKNEYDIQHLEQELLHAQVIDESALSTTVVNVGSVVTIQNADSGTEARYHIVGTSETNPAAGKISNLSPIGAALLGHSADEIVEVVTPGGLLKLKIIQIGK